MRRRELILGAAAAVVPRPGLTADRNYRIGFVAQIGSDAPQWAEVLDELQQAGFVEGKNLAVDRRGLGVALNQMDGAVAELIAASPDVIYCGGDTAMHAAARATHSIPVVATADDYLATGLVESLARPGGNFTGVSLFAPELNGKRIELLSEMLPGIRRIAVLADRNVAIERNLQAIEDSVKPRGIDLAMQWVMHEHEVAPAITAAQAAGAEAISVLSSPLLHSVHGRILEMVAAFRLPAVFQWPDYAAEGALAAYGPRLLPVFRQIGREMVKILKGAKPADMPIEQPTKLELIVNLRTAKAIGLTIPPSVLARADEVIE